MIYYIGRFIIGVIKWIDLTLLTLILYLLSWLPRAWTQSFYHGLFRFWCRVFVNAFGVDLRLHQNYRGQLPKQYILIANHPSAFEDIGLTTLFNAYFVAKVEVASWFVVGRISQAANTLFVERESKESRRAIAESIKAKLKKGHNVAIYPEGGCKGRHIADKFYYGIFDISLQTGIPIIPVFIHYEAQEDFEWMDQHLLVMLWQFLTAKNKVANYYVFDPFNPKEYQSKEQYNEAVHKQYLEWQDKYLK